MFNKNHLRWFFAISSIVFIALAAVVLAQVTQDKVTGIVSQKETGNNSNRNPVTDFTEFENVGKQILKLGSTRDLRGLATLQEEVEDRWGSIQPISFLGGNLYAGLMRKICSSFSSGDFGNDERYALARKCVKQALKHRDKMRVEEEAGIVPLSTTPEYMMGVFTIDEWQADRRERAELWFHAWWRLGMELDKDFDINSKRPVNKTYLTPAERAAIETYNKQYRLHRLNQDFSKQFKDFVVATYSILPYNDTELESFIAQYIADPEFARELRQEIRNRQKIGELGVKVRQN